MRSTLTSLIQLAGAAAVVVGLFHAWHPLGWIAAGATAVYAGHELDG